MLSHVRSLWQRWAPGLRGLRRRPALGWGVGALATVAVVYTALAANYTFTVNSNADDADANVGDGICATASGVCTLRAALQEANANTTGSTTINFGLGTCQASTMVSGLRGDYFNNKTVSGAPALTRYENVNFNWGTGSPGTGIGTDNFSARWTGRLIVPTTGSYTFSTISDDGVRLWVNGSQVINNWTDHAPTQNNSASISLTAGQQVTVTMEFYENGGGAVAQLFWMTPGSGSFVIIPSTNLTAPSPCVIQPQTPLPTVTRPVSIMGNTQSGYSSSPVVELDGTYAGGSAIGLTLATVTNSVIKALAINNFSAYGVYLNGGSNNTLTASYVGLNRSGTTAAANGSYGVVLSSTSNNTIGGTAAGAGNVVAGTPFYGLYLEGSNSNTIQGNLIGTNAAGTAALGNVQVGIMLHASSSNVIGGSAAGARNVISGSTYYGGIYAYGASNSNVIKGNYIGTDITGSNSLANGNGILLYGANNTVVGGTAAGEGNIIAFGTGGVLVANVYGEAAVAGNVISGNSIFGNSSGGILLDGGLPANDGSTTASAGNLQTDSPVITSATYVGSTLTVAGYVGSAAGQAAFANNTVEVFVSSTTSGNGQGKTYLGSLTTSGSNGNFSGTITAAGLTVGSYITATARDAAGNTSIFSTVYRLPYMLSGTVFEDVNYGGGAGRNLATSGGVGVSGAIVELYDSTGTFVSSTTTAAGGTYSFAVASGTYHVRVVSGSVLSSRTGSTSAVVGIMTFRTDASTGTPVDVTNYVGGTDTASADGGAGSAGTAFNTSNFAFTSGTVGVVHAVSKVVVGSASISGLDFGFNFDTVTNFNSGALGSLAQVITNANTLGGDASLAQSGRPAGVENVIFMISNGTNAPGLRSNLTYFSGGVATITMFSAYPTITTPMVLDAQFQPGWTSAPVVELNGTSAGTGINGLNVQAANVVIRGFIINRYKSSGIAATSAATGLTVQGCYIGTNAAGTAASANSNIGISLTGTPNAVIGGTTASQRNVISGNTKDGINATGATVTGTVIQGNYIGLNAAGTAAIPNGPTAGNGQGIKLLTNATGVTIGGSVAGAGNVISGNGYIGIDIYSGSHTIQGNIVGLDPTGTTKIANGAVGIAVETTAGPQQIGGTTTLARNVVSGNNLEGMYISGTPASGTVIQGNYVGTDITGTLSRSNGRAAGIYLGSSITNVVIGGTAAGAGNLISGNSGVNQGGIVLSSGTGHKVQGNTIGLSSSGAALPNGNGVTTAGVYVFNSTGSSTIGGTTAGAANVISGNAGVGVAVVGNTTGIAIQRNSIYANARQGIDLALDGITTNDGAKPASNPNLLMDYPVITSATLSGTTLTVSGYVGSAASQSTFASATVEVFISDGSTANGSGKTYLGTVTADASGNIVNQTITGVTGLTPGTSTITATATDASGNTSEFGPNFLLTLTAGGKVFEDVNYGGGAGRSQATSAGVGVSGATVELYGSTGSYVSSTTTASDGSYLFSGLASGNYYVRVVGSTVLSSRTGSSSSLVGVMTYRTDASSGTATAVTDNVGGTNPALVDPGAASSGAAFNTSTWVFSSGLSGTAQHVAPITVGSGAVTGVDFGFNFDTVVNANDTGQGSLRQAIINANTLGNDAALSQSGRTAGVENLVFMLPNGTAAAGLRSSYNAFTSNVATITLASTLPTVNSTLVVDAQTQPGWSSNPMIELNGAAAGAGANGFTITASSAIVRGFIINRFTQHGVYITGATGTVQGCWVGTNSTGTAASANGGSGIYTALTGHTIGGASATQRNLVSGNTAQGIVLSADSGSTGASTVAGNYVGTNLAGSGAIANGSNGIYVATTGNTIGGSVSGAGNLVSGNTGKGIVLAAASNTVQGNLVGTNLAGTGALANASYGVYLAGGDNQVVGGTGSLQRNVISGNGFGGIIITGGGGHTVQGNYIGTNAAGTGAVGNTGYFGIELYGTGGNQIGGTAAGAGNVISGQSTANKGGIYLASSNNTIQGNLIGTNATNTGAIGNAGPGISIAVANVTGNTIGGTAAGAGNVIANNGQQGIAVLGANSINNNISRNSIYGNTGIGIDIAGNGRTTNNGTRDVTLGNADVDTPVITSAGLMGNSLVLYGYVGSAANQSLWANHRVEFFLAVNDGTGYGQGKTYLGTLTTDANGNFAGSFITSGLVIGNLVTATAADSSGNTSEFSANATIGKPSAYGVSGADMWVDASDVNGDGNATAQPSLGASVVQLTDKSGNARHFVNTGSAGTQPVLTSVAQFKQSVLRFTTAQWMKQAANWSGGPVTVIYVAAPTDPANSTRILQGISNNWLLGWRGVNGHWEDLAYYEGWVTAQPGTGVPSTNVAKVYSAVIRGAGQASDAYRNGVLLASNTSGTTGPNGLTVNNGPYGDVSASDVAEILVFPRALTSTERSTVETALMAKWFNFSSSTLSGMVFEDANYGGGAGRSMATASGTAVSGATVELYNSTGNLIGTTTTAADGSYSFGGLAAGNYYVRVPSSGVKSNRTGSTGSLVGVMTYRTDASGGTATAVSNYVGGTNPALVDAGVASSGTTFNTSSFVFSAGLSGTAQNVTPVTLGGSSISGLDFGFNFDTVVNTNDSGQGSLRQAITNANTLGGDASLAQSGRTAGIENLIFMLSNGSTGSGGSLGVTGGLRSTNTVFSSGVASITLASALPTVSTTMVIDAQAQPGWTSAAPIVELNGNAVAANAFNVQAANVVLRGLVINRFTGDAVLANSAASGLTVQGNYIGTNAAGTAASANAGSGINLSGTPAAQIGGTSGVAVRNVISGNTGNGVLVTGATATGTVIQGNYLGNNASGSAAVPNAGTAGVYLSASATGVTVGGLSSAGAGNVISGNTSYGVRIDSAGNSVKGNIIGATAAGTSALGNTLAGVYFGATVNSATVGGTVAGEGNVITSNGKNWASGVAGDIPQGGVVVNCACTGITLAGNTIGLGTDGLTALGNRNGVLVSAGASFTIGGPTSAHRNVISGNLLHGVSVVNNLATTVTVQNNWIGLATDGSTARGNGTDLATDGVVYWQGTGGVQVLNNVIASNTRYGIWFWGGNGHVVKGNLIGTDSSGTLARGNTSYGVYANSGATATIGTITGGDGNTIANNSNGVVVNDASLVTIRGNSIYANTALGIDLGANGATANDGAKTTGQPNLLMDKPVITKAVLGPSTASVVGYVGSAALQSTFGGALVDIYASASGQGKVYLGTVTANADGEFAGVVSTAGITGLTAGTTALVATATDGAGNTSEFGNAVTSTALAALSNGGFESGTAPGSYLTLVTGDTSNLAAWVVTGTNIDYVGTFWAAAEGSRSLDLSGQARGGVAQVVQTVPGQAYTLRFAAAVNALPATVRVTAGSTTQTLALSNAAPAWADRAVTFTATSEATVLWFESLTASNMGPALDNVRLTTGAGTANLSGTVFEDVNYGGGAGRSLAGASGVARSGASVELFDASGNLVGNTTTDGSGAYAFNLLPAGNYTVRVVSSTVTSSRSGYVNTLLPVVTYRTNASTGAAVADTAYVGGASPALADAGKASTTLAALTTASTTAQAITPVTVGASNITGLDFGFNFSTIVNTNDSGQGSLRQWITNANTLGGETSLAQAGRTAGVESSIFMLRTTDANYSGGVWTITPSSALPTLTASNMVLDGLTQSGAAAGNLWAGTPHTLVVSLSGSNAGLAVTGTDVTVRGLVIGGTSGAGITATSSTRFTLRTSYIGLNAAGTAANNTGSACVALSSSASTEIGGLGTGDGNVLAGTSGSLGVMITINRDTDLAVRGNFIGSNASGLAKVGSNVTAFNNSSGTFTMREIRKNLIVGSTMGGVVINGDDVANASSGTWSIAGNYIGVGRDGSTVLSNAVGLSFAGTNNINNLVIGGTSAADRNVISGNTGAGISSSSTGTGNSIVGNYIGVAADGSTAKGNGGAGITISNMQGLTIGGTAAGAANTIANNGGAGVAVTAGSANVNLSANSIYANTGLGIDLGTAGITVNTGAKTSGQPNQLMNYPVVTNATVSSGTMTVAGYVGSAAGQSAFASARVEFFISDSGSANGSGKTYLGALTADASGNFSGTVSGVAGISNGSGKITATATDASGNTSEFGPNYAVGLTVSGTVFEDINYGGGAGRNLAGSGGPGVSGARVELYDANGSFVSAGSTDANGRYTLYGLANSSAYFVRVVGSTVVSTRSGSTASLVPVLTYRTEAPSGTPTAVVNEVGGANPAVADAAAGSTGTSMWTLCATEHNTCSFTGTRTVRYGSSTSTGSGWATRVLTGSTICDNSVFGDPYFGMGKACYLLNADYQNLSTVFAASSSITGADFGFNFDTVVNTNDSGQGSLRQAMINANTLGGDASLAQAGRPAGIESLVFMISNGTTGAGGSLSLAAGGLRSSYNYFSTSAGSYNVATITPLTALPVMTTVVVIDAQTQPGWSQAPLIEINGTSGANVFWLSGGGSTLRGFVVNRLGSSAVAVGIDTLGGNTVQGNYLGLDASGATGTRNGCQLVNISTGANLIGGNSASARNAIGMAGCNNVVINAGAANVIQGNYMGTMRRAPP